MSEQYSYTKDADVFLQAVLKSAVERRDKLYDEYAGISITLNECNEHIDRLDTAIRGLRKVEVCSAPNELRISNF